MNIMFEVCVDSVEGALAAQQGGAQRVELCDNLVEGGTTPSIGAIRYACKQCAIPVHVIIRPRGGDFCYSDLEFTVMKEDILASQQAGAAGIVTGILLPNGRVDKHRMRLLVNLAAPLPVTFHRAIDLCRDSFEALEDLAELGVVRVLTSGRKATAIEGAECIAALVRQSAGCVRIIAGGGVNANNLTTLIAATGVREVHFSARSPRTSPMTFRNPGVMMGKAYQPDEYSRPVTDAERVRSVIQSLQ